MGFYNSLHRKTLGGIPGTLNWNQNWELPFADTQNFSKLQHVGSSRDVEFRINRKLKWTFVVD